MKFDPQQFKAQFPLFNQPENQQLVYLDNAATTQRPQAVIDAISHFYCHDNANTHRSSHRLARQATAMVERCRDKAAHFLGAEKPEEVIFCRGATEALNLLANSLGENLIAGDEIILSTAEHHANLVPWQMLAQRHGVKLRFVEDKQGVVCVDQLSNLLSERTRIISITAASNALGIRTDLMALKQKIKAHQKSQNQDGIVWIVDAAQLAAHEHIDVQTIGCDFLVCSAHKFYGPTGIGLLYGRASRLAKLPPWQGGGEMITHVKLHTSEYADAPHRFETGTSSLAAIAGLEAAFDWWQRQERSAMMKYEQALTAYLYSSLGAIDFIRILSSEKNNVGVIAFVPAADVEENSSTADIAHWLDEHDIAVRVGHHCAMPLIDRLGVGATLRISVCAYNSFADIDRLCEVLRSLPLAENPLLKLASLDSDIFDISQFSLDELKVLRNWQKRYKLLLQWGEYLEAQPAIRQDSNLVKGCEVDAWLVHHCEEGRHYFNIASDSRVVRGLAVLLLVFIQGRTRDEIQQLDLKSAFTELGLEKHLSPSRTNGFWALVKRALLFTEQV
jgi:cysteine desulfurase / selenocysteine lyase